MTEMTSSRPYLLRALYEWIVDNGLTPLLLIDAKHEDVTVPQAFVEEGKIILNASPTAIKGLVMDNDHLTFSARFSGQSHEVYAPITAILAVYARENGRGMLFAEETGDHSEPPPKGGGKSPASAPETTRPKLRVVK